MHISNPPPSLNLAGRPLKLCVKVARQGPRTAQPVYRCVAAGEQHSTTDGKDHSKLAEQTRLVKKASAAPQNPSVATVSRRNLIRGALTSTLATGAPTLLQDELATLPAEALPITSRLPPIGQAPPGSYNLGVAAVRDPALYRSEQLNRMVTQEETPATISLLSGAWRLSKLSEVSCKCMD